MALNPSSGWNYYAALNISNPNTDYQMRLDIRRGTGTNDPANGIIYEENHCHYSDMRDIRVGTTNNPSTATQLKQWTEKVEDSIKRVIWIKTNGSSTLYLFAGNKDADEYSDENTFIFLDDFDTDTIGSYIHQTDSYRDSHYVSNVVSDIPAIIEYRFKITIWDADSQWGTTQEVGFADDTVANPSNYRAGATAADADIADNTHLGIVVRNRKDGTNNNVLSSSTDVSFSLNTYYIYIVEISETVTKIYLYNDDRTTQIYTLSNSNNIPTVALPHLMLLQYHGYESGSTYAFEWDNDTHLRWYGKRDNYTEQEKYMDWIFVRKYASPEPQWSFGSWVLIEVKKPIIKKGFVEGYARRSLKAQTQIDLRDFLRTG